MALNANDIDKILAHVGHCHVPRDLDKAALKDDINIAWDFYKGYRKDTAKGARTSRREYAHKIESAANQLYELLRDPDDNAKIVRRSLCRSLSAEHDAIEHDAAPLLPALIEDILRLAHAAAIAERRFAGATMRDSLRTSPWFRFLGDDLAEVFEKHFRQEATRTRGKDRQLEGPFILFATAVTAQLGEPALAETVSKAMSEVAKH